MIATSRQLVAPEFPPSRASHGRLITAMGAVESLPLTASGALMVGTREKPIGTILVESNRVCWIAAAGMSRRLRDILRGHCGIAISEENLDAIYERCRRERRPLGEALVASGLVSSEQMRSAIKQHTVESLLAVDASLVRAQQRDVDAWPLTWIEHAGHGYNPRYTFSATEILAAAGALSLDETTADLVADHLNAIGVAACAAVAFGATQGGTPLFVGARTTLSVSVQHLLELAAWADAALAASNGFSPEVAHSCARSSRGGAVAWRYEGQRCAAICLDGPMLQRVTASLGNLSLSVVLATRIAVLDRVREHVLSTNPTNQGD